LQKSDWEIVWSEFLSVGVSEMDAEHRQFIARVNELNRAIVESEDKAQVAGAMERMMEEAAQHFSHEEELLARWKYPDVQDHIAKHVQLSAQFEKAKTEFTQTDISFIWALKALHLKQLLVEHLLKEDLKYRDFLRAQR